MLHDLHLVHRIKPEVFNEAALRAADAEASLWSTCLRSLVFVPSKAAALELANSPQDEIHSGRAAYQFVLEIICGLHSPIAGETEVLGQFKAFSQQWVKQDPRLGPLIQRWFADAKRVRSQHLSHLGNQSYGSWVRRNLSATTVHFLGAGLLTREIYPYLVKKGLDVSVHARAPERVGFVTASTATRVCALRDHQFNGGALIVAAPVSSVEICAWLKGRLPEQIFDLRDSSKTDPLLVDHVFSLHEIFAEIERTKRNLLPRLAAARADIHELSLAVPSHAMMRPQGWDDLCA